MKRTFFILISLIGLFAISSALDDVNIVQQPQCKENGEYCQNHWECCSNSCFSYLYKCVKSYQQNSQPESSSVLLSSSGNSIAGTGDVNRQHSSLESLLSSFFAPTPAPPRVDQTIEFDLLANRFGSADAEGATTSTTDNPNSEVTTVEVNSGNEINRNTTTQKSCLAIGQKCYFYYECCSQRCHGFLHQCVT